MNSLSSNAWMPQVEAASAAASLVQSGSCGGGQASMNASAKTEFGGPLQYHLMHSTSRLTFSRHESLSSPMEMSFAPRDHNNRDVLAQHRRMAWKPQALRSRTFSSTVKERLLGQLSFWNSSCSGLGGSVLRTKRALSSRSYTQQVLNSNSGSKLAFSHGSCLSERIASSQFCSSSTSVLRWDPFGGEVPGGVQGRHFLGKCGQRRVRRGVAAAVSADGLKQMNFYGSELYSRWSERRIQRAPKIAAGRGTPQPASENWDVGEYRLETNTEMDDFGDVSFGDESLADDVELSSDLAAARFDHNGMDDSSGVRHAHSEDSDDMTEDPKSTVPRQDWISKRWGIVLLCFFAFLLCNMDRVNMSIAILPMSAEYHWNPTTVGLVQSSFFWGYLLTQVAGGIWADSIGGKHVLGFGVVWWSLATVATPIAAKIGLPVLFFVRACMGVGEGVAMPAMNNLLSKWIPVGERSRSLALVYSGMYLGSVIGLACSPGLIQKFGWPSVFFTFGSVGTIWFAVWERYAQSSPGEDPTLTDAERNLILKTNKPREPITKIPWGLLLSKAPVWALIVSHFCHNWGTFILLTWMPTYYNQVLGFNLMESGMFSVLPWLTMAISANVGGWIADTLVSKGMSVTTVRKIMQSIGFLGPAFFLTQLSHIREPHLAVLCMMASQGSDAFSQSGLYSNHQDIGPRYSGILLGLSNTAGVLAGVVGTAATGYILQHGTWDDVFKVAVGLYLFGTVVWNLFSTGEQLFD